MNIRINKGHLIAFALIICHLSFSLALTSCKFEQEDYFDEPASLRITHLNEQLQQRLVNESSNANGWVIQYFVGGTDDLSFEGFNLFGHFYADGKVTLAGNHRYLRGGNANKYTEHTSTYEMLAEEGPVLSFNTWNDILTVFVDPVNPTAAPNTLANDGEGMNGDHNLVLRSYDDDQILFRGERHSAQVRFIPCDRSWEDYIAAVNETKSKIATQALPDYYVINADSTMYFSGLYAGVFNYCDRVYDPLNNTVVSCVFTPTGFRLGHQYSLGDDKFQEFTVLPDSTGLVSEDGNVKVIPCWDSYVIEHDGIWQLDASLFSAEQQSLFSQIDEEIKKFNAAWSLAHIGMGHSSGSNAVDGLVLTFYTNTRKTSTNTGGLALSISQPAFGQMAIESSADDEVDRNMATIVARGADNMENLARSFARTVIGTYEMTPDNHFLPTSSLFTPIAGGTAFRLNQQ